jgi:hypothetical protein
MQAYKVSNGCEDLPQINSLTANIKKGYRSFPILIWEKTQVYLVSLTCKYKADCNCILKPPSKITDDEDPAALRDVGVLVEYFYGLDPRGQNVVQTLQRISLRRHLSSR